jgi:hypothetical protein
MKALWFRRRPDPEKVRETLRDLPPVDPPLVQTAFGEVIVQLRGDIQKARNALDRGDVETAKDVLAYALHEDRWGQ